MQGWHVVVQMMLLLMLVVLLLLLMLMSQNIFVEGTPPLFWIFSRLRYKLGKNWSS